MIKYVSAFFLMNLKSIEFSWRCIESISSFCFLCVTVLTQFSYHLCLNRSGTTHKAKNIVEGWEWVVGDGGSSRFYVAIEIKKNFRRVLALWWRHLRSISSRRKKRSLVQHILATRFGFFFGKNTFSEASRMDVKISRSLSVFEMKKC